jgi:threonine synthase
MDVTSRPALAAVSLGEGNTPLVRAARLSAELGLDVHLKCEGANPTGSFKDRGMVVTVGRAVEEGARAVVCASTGNTAASAAAYAARAGLRAVILTPAGATAGPKRAQARAVGARLLEVAGTFDDALRLCLQVAEQDGYVLANSLNPNRIEGQKSVAAELIDQLGTVPDVVTLPYGGGGNLTAVALGFAQAGAAPRLVAGESASRPTTWASAIRIAEPAHRAQVAALVAEGRAEIVSLTEDEIGAAWRRLAADEGVFCEPASAASLAALRRIGLRDGSRAVCILTGHGLKDAGEVEDVAGEPVAPTLEAIMEALE